MKNAKLLLLAAFGFWTFQSAQAQQDPQYTQYMYNMNVVNPAYAGSKENLQVNLLYRDQWEGIEGAPRTFTFDAHTPITGSPIGVGLSAISDKLGPVTKTNVYADVSYTIKFRQNHKLAFGVKLGATFNDIGLASDVALQDPNDLAFSKDINATYPNFGAGVLYYTHNWYIGFSVPDFLTSTHLDADGRKFGEEDMNFFLTAGYVFQVSRNLKFKPSTLIKSAFSSPLSFDVNANFLFYNRFEVGVSYRLQDAVSALVSVKATKWFQVGVAYDHSISDIDQPSYEAFLLFNIGFHHKIYRSQRYF